MANKLDLRSSENIRFNLTRAQQSQVRNLYKKISKNIQVESAKLPNTTSGILRKSYLKALQAQINEQLDALGSSVESTIRNNMFTMAESVVKDNEAFLLKVGMPVQGAFSHVPGDIVKIVSTGQLYEGNWSLSGAIWKTTKKAQQDINTIIAQGIAQNKSSLEIARDLEKYVNPAARKPWDWSKVYPGVSTKVDYNAQRLARTMVSHAYQQAFVRTTQRNPFVEAYKWEISNSDRVCEICKARSGRLYPKDDLPLDHPNGMCTFTAVIPDSMVDIADRIADWAHGSSDPALDDFAEFLKNS